MLFRSTSHHEVQKQMTRAYASLCIGSIGDKRAFAPLIKMLSEDGKIEDRYNVQSYAAISLGYLNDPNAIPYLEMTLNKSDNIHVKSACIRSLAVFFDMRTISILKKYIVPLKTKQYDVLAEAIDESMGYLVKRYFRRSYNSEQQTVFIQEIPELGHIDAQSFKRTMWRHWLNVGGQIGRAHV